MASEIRVTNIKANDGTSSLTVANFTGAVTTTGNTTVGGTLTSTGAITASGGIANAGTISAGTIGIGVTGFTGIKEADQFRINSNTTGNGDLTSNWERVDDSNFARIGSGISEASGVFSFTQTGIYFIQAFSMFKSTSGEHNYAGLGIYIDQGSGYSLRAETFNGINRGDAFCTTTLSCFFDVTDTNNDKVKFNRSVSNSLDIRLVGSSSYNANSFTFFRLGDT